ncbi:hypothetical protein PAXRUDRAFT_821068 [Paxillus rubicundulus Ve08.2h10]|uniref:WLM-domain-containing protein n=1 Tax=Paxillus rubicundulus Ve08.2h10 TaxID=930991 RepID=A0A0D0DPM0_9AGAM|nr:hypothetical protein PAXRUDRAFT_821068 [Paxillus rubicundulus Ve08.2h10]
MTETFVKSFTHLKDMPRAERALPMLYRVASLVKPIMRKHGWVLPLLAEFFPDSSNLVALHVNGGEQILLRLRLPWSPDTFYEEDQVVRTMLHELTHNVQGPHDERFYKILAGLEDEYDALQRSGYAGEGFFSPGHRLGAGVSHDIPPYLGRLRALEAAEKRRRGEALTKGGGTLGGRSSALGKLSPRELAARAAERRKRDELTCGSVSIALREAAKAAKASAEDKVVIDLTKDDQDTSQASGSGRPPRNPSMDGQWTCPICTLANGSLTLQCDACLAERPADSVGGWVCLTCLEKDIPHEFWSCHFCGGIKTQS